MGVTLILAGAGEGKTGLLAAILKKTKAEKGRELLSQCRKELERLNVGREIPYDLPEEPPIYVDGTSLKVKYKIGYNKWYEPFSINPYYMGVGEDKEYILPYGVVFIPEIQKYAPSRKSANFPAAFGRIFEIWRHLHYDIYMDGHRGSFIDLKVRGMCTRVIDLLKQEHEYDDMGRIVKTTWYCREFKNIEDYDKYTAGNLDVYNVETTYENEGDIFKDYDSFGCAEELLPPGNAQFSMHKSMTYAEAKAKLPPEQAKFFNPVEPKSFRSGAKAAA